MGSSTSPPSKTTKGKRRSAGTSSVSVASSASSHHWMKHWAGRADEASNRNRSAVWAGRLLFVLVLGVVAALLVFVTLRHTRTAEENLARSQFESISSRALVEAEKIAHSRRWAGVTMAAIVSELYPNASQWPFIEFLGFERLARGLLNTSLGVDMGVVPFLFDLDQLPAFEEHAYAVYNKMGWDNETTAVSPFGRGIWGQKPVNASDPEGPKIRYHDTTGNTVYKSPYRVISPIFRTDEGPHPVLLFNPHSGKFQGEAIDRMITCAYNRKAAYEEGQADVVKGESNCGVITDVFTNVKQGGRWGAALLRPIHPVNDPLEIVGYIPTLFLVDELLENVFNDEISGIDAVFKTQDRAVTFTVLNGQGTFVDVGDLHDRKYDEFEQTIELVDHVLFTEGSPTFYFSLYPNDGFASIYETNNPAVASLVTVGIMLFTCLAFFLYDWLVRREFHAKRSLLDARRQFMRFVSHEVRTPLNSVSMGLDLLQGDLAKVLGYESVNCVRAMNDFMDSTYRGAESETPKPMDSSTQKNGEAVGMSQTLCERKALEWFRLTQEIEANSQGAIDILNDLLNFDKIERGTLQLQLGVVSAWNLIEKVILEFKLPASSKKILLNLLFNVEKDEDDSLEKDNSVARGRELPLDVRNLCLLGDSVRLTQVLRNMMSNALKFTPEGGSIRVKASFVESKQKHAPEQKHLSKTETVTAAYRGKLKVDVQDSGAGMSPEQLARLFRDGVQFNANELQAGGGSGLGLFIAKGLAKQHKGTLSATSAGLGLGSTFSLSLPLWDVPEDEEKRPAPRMMGTGSELSTGSTGANSGEPVRATSLYVLVVDDVLSNRKLLRRLLETKGHTCAEAEDGRKAVEMVQAASVAGKPFESVLMDYEMPRLDGPSAVMEIRQLGIDVNIVGITGNVLPDDVSYFLRCGANEVLSKPVKYPELESLWSEYGVYDQFRDEEDVDIVENAV